MTTIVISASQHNAQDFGLTGRGARTDEQNNAWCERWAREIGVGMRAARVAAGLPAEMPDHRTHRETT